MLVQVISSEWTKQSRGHPGSVIRAAVPEGLNACATPGRALVQIERFKAYERAGFELVRSTEVANDLPVQVAGIDIRAEAQELRVTRLGETRRGWPSRPYDSTPIALGPGETCRIIRNYRRSGYSRGWTYEKLVVNVANAEDTSGGVDFGSRSPDFELDEQRGLR